jgi:hypothetical protein
VLTIRQSGLPFAILMSMLSKNKKIVRNAQSWENSIDFNFFLFFNQGLANTPGDYLSTLHPNVAQQQK